MVVRISLTSGKVRSAWENGGLVRALLAPALRRAATVLASLPPVTVGTRPGASLAGSKGVSGPGLLRSGHSVSQLSGGGGCISPRARSREADPASLATGTSLLVLAGLTAFFRLGFTVFALAVFLEEEEAGFLAGACRVFPGS